MNANLRIAMVVVVLPSRSWVIFELAWFALLKQEHGNKPLQTCSRDDWRESCCKCRIKLHVSWIFKNRLHYLSCDKAAWDWQGIKLIIRIAYNYYYLLFDKLYSEELLTSGITSYVREMSQIFWPSSAMSVELNEAVTLLANNRWQILANMLLAICLWSHLSVVSSTEHSKSNGQKTTIDAKMRPKV